MYEYSYETHKILEKVKNSSSEISNFQKLIELRFICFSEEKIKLTPLGECFLNCWNLGIF